MKSKSFLNLFCPFQFEFQLNSFVRDPELLLLIYIYCIYHQVISNNNCNIQSSFTRTTVVLANQYVLLYFHHH